MSDVVLCNCLADIRTDCGLTQAQLAEAVGCSKNTISSIENGSNVRVLLARKIAFILGVHVEDIWILKGGRNYG